MQARQLDSFDVQAIIGGWWPRGCAEVSEVERIVALDAVLDAGIQAYALEYPCVGADRAVKVVDFKADAGYPLNARNARAARDRLLLLAGNPSDQAIAAFVSRYGPLLNFTEWIADIKMHRSTTVNGARRIWPMHWDPRYDGDVLYGSDALSFAHWCEQTDDTETSTYVQWAMSVIPRHPELGPSVFPEPAALYRWAAQRLEQLRNDRQLQREDRQRGRKIRPLSEQSQKWLTSRLGDTRLHPSQEPGKLVIRATSLLAYLAAYTYMDVFSHWKDFKACKKCGEPFMPEHGHQDYCSRQHRQAAQQARYRQNRKGRQSPHSV